MPAKNDKITTQMVNKGKGTKRGSTNIPAKDPHVPPAGRKPMPKTLTIDKLNGCFLNSG